MGYINCCYQCPDRYVGCHSKCEKYLAERAKLDEQRRYEQLHPVHYLKHGDFLGDEGLQRRRH